MFKVSLHFSTGTFALPKWSRIEFSLTGPINKSNNNNLFLSGGKERGEHYYYYYDYYYYY